MLWTDVSALCAQQGSRVKVITINGYQLDAAVITADESGILLENNSGRHFVNREAISTISMLPFDLNASASTVLSILAKAGQEAGHAN